MSSASRAASYDVYMIRVAGKNATVYTSEVARATNGFLRGSQSGGLQQTLVLDRSKFSKPVKIKTIP